jgi:Undecaprenyl-phosphate galactose phosphotransferase WbaP
MDTIAHLTGHAGTAVWEGVKSQARQKRHSRMWMAALICSADLAGLVFAGTLAVWLRLVIGRGFANPDQHLRLLPFLMIFLLAYAVRHLYPGNGLTPVEELRRLSLSTSITVLMVVAVAFWTQTSIDYSRLIFAFFWGLALVCVPLSRWLARRTALRLNQWGEPVALIGYGGQGRKIMKFLQENRQYGYNPMVIVNGLEAHDPDPSTEPCPEIQASALAHETDLLNRLGIKTAILVPSEVPEVLRRAIVDEQHFGLHRLILISNLDWFGSSAVIPHDLQGILGLEIKRNLLNRTEQVLKRGMELILISLSSPLMVPLMGLIALLIRLDSAGPIFFRQRRFGLHGEQLYVWKFRTMVENADQILAGCLSCDEELRDEWQALHKLKNDPRVTRFGRILRKTSLDELPQLWNVLGGEMSLVGPRPIVEDEIEYYAGSYRLYQQVRPGLTGLWQVSGRSDTSYANRVALDEYYVRHWSIWMDLYILIRTLWVVIKRSGAY